MRTLTIFAILTTLLMTATLAWASEPATRDDANSINGVDLVRGAAIRSDASLSADLESLQDPNDFVPAPAPNAGSAADINNDNYVDATDLAMLLAAWGNCPIDSLEGCPEDINHDYQINIDDLLIILTLWD